MRFVDSIEPAGEAETVCIQVAAADSLYVTDDFLLTHNTLNDSFVILDEAQNTSPEQMQMFLTRLGFGSKMVVTGDVTQVDLPREQALRADPGARHPRDGRRHRLRRVQPPGRRPPQARTADRGGIQEPRRADRDPAEPVIEVEIVNRSSTTVDEAAAVELAQSVLAAEGVGGG